MRFDDPLRLDCPGCGVALALPLIEVVGLGARCGACGHSFRQLGLSMRRHANALTRYFVVTEVMWMYEGAFDFTTEDDELDAVRTPRELVELVRRKAGEPVPHARILGDLASRIRRPIDDSHLDVPLDELVPAPAVTPKP